MSDHEWPARAAYLRRGTPVVALRRPTVVTDARAARWGYVLCHMPGHDRVPMCGISLDLRDVTARAHAAWAWLDDPALEAVMDARRSAIVRDLSRPDLTGEGWERCNDRLWRHLRHMRTLAGMGRGHPDVTIAEARAALAWAESCTEEDDNE